ncbi:MAG: hypothetical protein AB7O97_22120 [Planctomycetota bacterium]
MRIRSLLAVLASFLSAPCAPAQAPSSDVAVGVFPFLVGNMDGRIDEIVTACQTYGIDTLYVSVFRCTGPQAGQLWITDSAGDWNAAWGAVRSGGAGIHLPNLIAACHAADIRVVAVLKCFDDSVQPTSAAHKQFLLDVIDYLVDSWQFDGRPTYDVDGIALDYIRFVGSGTGNDPLQVTNFLADVRQRIGNLSLHCYLIANRFTFDGPTYNGNFNSYASVISSLASQFGQHWEQMAQYVDVMMPMSYTADGSIYNTTALHRAYVQTTAAYARNACTIAGQPLRRVCPVVRTYTEAGETTTVATVDASIVGALTGGGHGYQAFRYQHLVNNPAWWGPMQAHAVPGCNWPMPLATTTSPTLRVQFDPSASRDLDEANATLQSRFDFDGDGAFDTGWGPVQPTDGIPRSPGVWKGTMQVRDSQGHVATTRRRYTAGPGIVLSPPVISTSAGATVQIQLRTGPAAAGNAYILLPGISGTSPGTPWAPGFHIPLNLDFLTDIVLSAPNNPLLAGGAGTFDAQGNANATLLVPPGLLSVLNGTSMFWTFAAVDAQWQPMCVSEADPLLLFP